MRPSQPLEGRRANWLAERSARDPEAMPCGSLNGPPRSPLLPRFVKVVPTDYKRVLAEQAADASKQEIAA